MVIDEVMIGYFNIFIFACWNLFSNIVYSGHERFIKKKKKMFPRKQHITVQYNTIQNTEMYNIVLCRPINTLLYLSPPLSKCVALIFYQLSF